MIIPKNSTRAKEALAQARNVRCYSLSNNFSGVPLPNPAVIRVDANTTANVSPMQFLRHELETSHNAKLRHDGNDRYSVNIHSNLWYEFESETSRGE